MACLRRFLTQGQLKKLGFSVFYIPVAFSLSKCIDRSIHHAAGENIPSSSEKILSIQCFHFFFCAIHAFKHKPTFLCILREHPTTAALTHTNPLLTFLFPATVIAPPTLSLCHVNDGSAQQLQETT